MAVDNDNKDYLDIFLPGKPEYLYFFESMPTFIGLVYKKVAVVADSVMYIYPKKTINSLPDRAFRDFRASNSIDQLTKIRPSTVFEALKHKNVRSGSTLSPKLV